MRPAIQVLVGICLADFLVAFFHFLEDEYLPNSHRPILGNIARDNEMHHYVPYTITSSTWMENITVSGSLAVIIVALIALLAPRWSSKHVVLLGTALAVGTVSNILHKYQHERDCKRPKWISALMNAGIIVSREEHKEHHADPSTRYGVVTSLGNAMYDGLGVWKGLKAIIPLPKYPKLPSAAYDKEVPDEIKTVVNQECPRQLTKQEIDALFERIDRKNM